MLIHGFNRRSLRGIQFGAMLRNYVVQTRRITCAFTSLTSALLDIEFMSGSLFTREADFFPEKVDIIVA